MKKILSINLIILMLLLCSCGQTSKVKPTEKVSNTVSEKTTTKTTETTSNKLSVSETTSIVSNNTTTSKTNTNKSTTSKSNNTTKSTSATATKKEIKYINCTVEIICDTIKNNKRNLKPEKKEFVPKKYVILSKKTITVPEGSSAFDAIKKVCKDNKCDENCVFCNRIGYIQLDFVYTPGFDSNYIRGIHQLYEKDCGTRSGWMYSVNGVFPNYGCNQYELKNNDSIKVLYTCDLGDDLK